MKSEQAQQLRDYLREFVGAGESQKTYEHVENGKRAALEDVFSKFTPEAKQRIRAGMKFRVVDKKGKKHEKSFDKRGQEYSVDTFGSTKQGRGIDSLDQPKVQAAMDEIVELTRRAIDKLKDLKKPDGKPVYDFASKDKSVRLRAQYEFTNLIEHEVFTPLVREGVMPENFVLDEYSEVQKLLNGTFQSYRQTTEESRQDEELELAEMRSNAKGKKGKLDILVGSIDMVKENLKGQVLQKLRLSKEQGENLAKTADFGKQGIVMTGALIKAGITLKKWMPEKDGTPKIVKSQQKLLDPQKFKNTLGDVKDDDGNVTGSYSKYYDDDPNLTDGTKVEMSDDALRVELAQMRRARVVTNVFDLVEDITGVKLPAEFVIKVLDKVVDSDGVFYTQASTKELIAIIQKGIVDLAVPGDKITKSLDKLDSLSKEYEAREAATVAAQKLDEKLAAAIGAAAGEAAGDAFEGMFLNELDLDALLEHTGPDTSGPLVAETIGDGIRAMFAAASPSLLEGMYEKFAAAGDVIAEVFEKKAPVKDFEKLIKKTPDAAFEPIVKAAVEAVGEAFPEEIKTLLSDEENLRKIAGKSLIPDEEQSLREWEDADEELKEYERALVLIDDGGITAAEQLTIERLIAEIEKDKATLKLVSNIGSTFPAIFGGGVQIANRITDKLNDVVVGEIVGPLKAAKLIMQFAVSVKKAADRQILLTKFRVDLERSKVAVSSLSSTIQGFLDNKVEQATFGAIETALLFVQAAAAVLGSIPEPHVMAIGKTLSACATAAKETAEMIEMAYSEKKLKEAWDKTKAALQNPRDRALGLAALRLNPTLGMHAIAWAGMQKTPPDPIARMFLNSVGVNEQTLAVSGTEKKVRQYLSKLLSDDRELIDSSKINSNWAPENFVLCAKDWFVVTSRAQRDAMPKLRAGDDKPVLEAIKKIDLHPIKKLEADARKGLVPLEELRRRIDETLMLIQALDNYQATAVDGSEHYEMTAIADEFLKLAGERKRALQEFEKNRNFVFPEKVLAVLMGDIDLFATLFEDKENGPPPSTSNETVAKALEIMTKHIQDARSRPALLQNKDIVGAIKVIEEYIEVADDWMQFNALRQWSLGITPTEEDDVVEEKEPVTNN